MYSKSNAISNYYYYHYQYNKTVSDVHVQHVSEYHSPLDSVSARSTGTLFPNPTVTIHLNLLYKIPTVKFNLSLFQFNFQISRAQERWHLYYHHYCRYLPRRSFLPATVFPRRCFRYSKFQLRYSLSLAVDSLLVSINCNP